jgi:hypothetical protein
VMPGGNQAPTGLALVDVPGLVRASALTALINQDEIGGRDATVRASTQPEKITNMRPVRHGPGGKIPRDG